MLRILSSSASFVFLLAFHHLGNNEERKENFKRMMNNGEKCFPFEIFHPFRSFISRAWQAFFMHN
jgi:hypothetical protein